MALTIQTQIPGQVVSDTYTYHYLYEPLPIVVTETDLDARELVVRLDIIDSVDNIDLSTDPEYALFDINPGQPINIDLAKIIRQAHDGRIYRYSSIQDIVNSKNYIIDKFRYRFFFSTDTTLDPIIIRKIPIIGGRFFKDFAGNVNEANPLTEFEVEGIDIDGYWKDFDVIKSSLRPLDALGNTQAPLTTLTISPTGTRCADGGMLYWKSRLGGWMQWGFKIKNEKYRSNYGGNIEVDYFDTFRGQVGQMPHVPVDYTSIEISNSIDLKSLSLSSAELRAVSSIATSPAVYYMKEPGAPLELMRVTNSSHPLNNQSNGGDFSVSLRSISTMKINTR